MCITAQSKGKVDAKLNRGDVLASLSFSGCDFCASEQLLHEWWHHACYRCGLESGESLQPSQVQMKIRSFGGNTSLTGAGGYPGGQIWSKVSPLLVKC